METGTEVHPQQHIHGGRITCVQYLSVLRTPVYYADGLNWDGDMKQVRMGSKSGELDGEEELLKQGERHGSTPAPAGHWQ